MSNEELMARFQKTGDENCFDTLYTRHRDKVRALIGRILAQCNAPPADLAAEVFAWIHTHKTAYTPGRYFLAFLWTATERVVLHYVQAA